MKTAKELLEYIDPSRLDYQDWCAVGMALKYEGYTAADWDKWSRGDKRYHPGECFKKWESFQRNDGVTGGTIYELARRGGYEPHDDLGTEIGWDDAISNDGVLVDAAYLDPDEFREPGDNWQPIHDLITYLQTLFNGDDHVGYVTEVYQSEDRLSPKKGAFDQTAGELIEKLQNCHGDIGAVIGDVNPKAGAWIRFNPLSGAGVRNEDVVDYRYALVESDTLELAKQEAIIRNMDLPVACMVYSGGKSIHAIVKIDAGDFTEYRSRVEYLYKICEKNGLKVDTQNKNPSRLSRMPGVIRNGHKQFLMATNIGKSSWEEWVDHVESVNDDLPDPECLADIWNDMPPLADCLIDGVLRKGHKMLISGPSKAGKSFALIELSIAIAEGRTWLGFQCSKGRVMYVNLELDRASCDHRFKDVYAALGWTPDNFRNIDIWNLRGKAVPMDKLAPKLIRRADKKGYTAIIIDPIYKIITGDENNATDMSNFCNQFDKVCTALKCAVIYCHHHSKGVQGNKKSMDRASGSGVFARDPDTMLDISDLEITDAIKAVNNSKARIRAIENVLDRHCTRWKENVSQDDRLSPTQMTMYAQGHLTPDQLDEMVQAIVDEEKKASYLTAWRIEGTLREFPTFPPVNVWFDYPIHRIDESGALSDVKVDDGTPAWQHKGSKKGQKRTPKVTQESFDSAFSIESADGDVTVTMMAEHMGVTERYVRDSAKKFGYESENGTIRKCSGTVPQ